MMVMVMVMVIDLGLANSRNIASFEKTMNWAFEILLAFYTFRPASSHGGFQNKTPSLFPDSLPEIVGA